MKPPEIDALFDIIAEYGEDMLSCADMPVKPQSRLRHSKATIKNAAVALHRLLETTAGRRFVLERYSPEFARQVVTEDYRTELRKCVLHLAEFVPDSDAALCQLEWSRMLDFERTGDVTVLDEITGVQRERIRLIRERVSTEKNDLFTEFRAGRG